MKLRLWNENSNHLFLLARKEKVHYGFLISWSSAVAGDKFLVYFYHLFIEVLEIVWELLQVLTSLEKRW